MLFLSLFGLQVHLVHLVYRITCALADLVHLRNQVHQVTRTHSPQVHLVHLVYQVHRVHLYPCISGPSEKSGDIKQPIKFNASKMFATVEDQTLKFNVVLPTLLDLEFKGEGP